MMSQQANFNSNNNNNNNNNNAPLNNSGSFSSSFGNENLWNRERGWLQGERRRGRGRSANYAPVQLQRQQQMEQALLDKLHHNNHNNNNNNNESLLETEMDKSLKTWKCEKCSLVNQLYYLKCLGCKSFLSTYIRIGILIQLFKHYMSQYSNYNNNQFNINTLFASSINHLYLITINKSGAFNNNNNNSNNDHFVLRLFKPMLSSQRKKLNECYNLFSQLNIGPTIFAQFEIGHIEEHISGKKIYHDRQKENQIWNTIIDKMLIIQNIKPNNQIFSKENDNFDNAIKNELYIMRKYINIDKEELKLEGFEFTGKDLKTIKEILRLFPDGVDSMLEEYNWLNNNINELLKQLPWENHENSMVFSHNDIYQGNIMEIYNNNQNQFDIKIIDYETCCWNNRYYDLANWLIELCIEYFQVPNYPYVVIDWNKYPNEAFRQKIGRYFLSKLTKKNENEIKESDIKMLFKIIDLNSLLSDFYQGIKAFNYGIINEHEGNTVVRGAKRRYNEPEQIRMDYFEYSVQRLKNYCYSRDQIIITDEKEEKGEKIKDAFFDLVLQAKRSLGFDDNNNNNNEQNATTELSSSIKKPLNIITNNIKDVANTFGFVNERKEKEDLKRYQDELIEKYANNVPKETQQLWRNVNNEIINNNSGASSFKKYAFNITGQVKKSWNKMTGTLGFNNNNNNNNNNGKLINSNVDDNTKKIWKNINNEIRKNNNNNYQTEMSKDYKAIWDKVANEIKNNSDIKKILTHKIINKEEKEEEEKQPSKELINEGIKFVKQISSNLLNEIKNVDSKSIKTSLGDTVNKVKDTLKQFNSSDNNNNNNNNTELIVNTNVDDKTKQTWKNINHEIKNNNSYQTKMSNNFKKVWNKIANEITNNNNNNNNNIDNNYQTEMSNDSKKIWNKVANEIKNNKNNNKKNNSYQTEMSNDSKKAWDKVAIEIKNNKNNNNNYQTEMSNDSKKAWDKVANEIKNNNNNNNNLINKGVKVAKEVASNISNSLNDKVDKVKDTLKQFSNDNNLSRNDGVPLFNAGNKTEAGAYLSSTQQPIEQINNGDLFSNVTNTKIFSDSTDFASRKQQEKDKINVDAPQERNL